MFSEMYFILNLLKWLAVLWRSSLICARWGKRASDLLEERQIRWKSIGSGGRGREVVDKGDEE
jgi:hypothetical protein